MNIERLKAGEQILFSGEIYTARDAAHKRMTEALGKGEPLPFNGAVYYCGPCPAPSGAVIGSAGPTTSSRMDKYSPLLIEAGIKIMIGKGGRNEAVVDAIREHKGVYLTAVGGAGALYAKCVEKAELIAYEDLGTEAIYKLTVRDMPLAVAIDCNGGSIF